MDEMRNPETLKEQEEYLRQMEREQAEAAGNGEYISHQVIVPTAVRQLQLCLMHDLLNSFNIYLSPLFVLHV